MRAGRGCGERAAGNALGWAYLGQLLLGFRVPGGQFLFELLDSGQRELELVHLVLAVALYSSLHRGYGDLWFGCC